METASIPMGMEKVARRSTPHTALCSCFVYYQFTTSQSVDPFILASLTDGIDDYTLLLTFSTNIHDILNHIRMLDSAPFLRHTESARLRMTLTPLCAVMPPDSSEDATPPLRRCRFNCVRALP